MGSKVLRELVLIGIVYVMFEELVLELDSKHFLDLVLILRKGFCSYLQWHDVMKRLPPMSLWHAATTFIQVKLRSVSILLLKLLALFPHSLPGNLVILASRCCCICPVSASGVCCQV